MRLLLVRAFTLIVIALALAGLWLALAPRGLAWIVWTLASLGAALVVVELALRGRRRAATARELERWQATLDDARARKDAIRELRRRIDRARRFGPRLRVEHARLATVLGELLVAEGAIDEAVRMLAQVPVDDLAPLNAAIVRHGRARAYLASGDADAAHAALASTPEKTGEPALDVALAIARSAVDLERGRLEDAADGARAVLDRVEDGETESDEAHAILAACMRARGDDEGARSLLAKTDDEGRRRLALLGSPAVKETLAR